ncbi:MAG: cyclic nucleotide-binding domain-containing protein [Alphaproteobacteria bacterium]|nr:cyclic nucleotide-binding domain-containing protein [Alphaproteobacteria bacterium]MBF0250088.1 cyclic nucleotide-binding domain-containing protein [Alphaproteobacteria bacterium]
MIRKENGQSHATLSPDDIRHINTAPLFSQLTREQVGSLLQNAHLHRHKASGLLFNQHDEVRNIYVLMEGLVTISLYQEDGSQVVIETVEPVRSFAEAAAFIYSSYPATAEFSAGSVIVSIPVDDFLRRLEQEPQMSFAVLGSLAYWERELTATLEALKLQSPAQRLIGQLVKDVPPEVHGKYDMTISISKAVLAKKLGIAPESLSRVLARLGQYGVQSSGRNIHFDDVNGLCRHFNVVRSAT